mgnify:CR=1 FL=1
MKITHFKTLESTNAYLQNLLNEGVDIIDNIIVTDFQTSGKGQGKNIWQSEDGKNLLFSIALDMSFLKAENQFLLTQMVSVVMIEVLKKYLPEDSLFIKWPNDIYFKNEKIAGILIKNEIKGMMMGTSIIGIGLNVNQTVFDPSLPNPTSMALTGKTQTQSLSLEPLLEEFVDIFKGYCSRYLNITGGLSRLRRLYLSQMWRKYIQAEYMDMSDAHIFKGIIRGLTDMGLLIVEDTEKGELKEFAFKEIGYII